MPPPSGGRSPWPGPAGSAGAAAGISPGRRRPTSARRCGTRRLWADRYRELRDGVVADLAAEIAAGTPLAEAIVWCQLQQLARCPDSQLARRHGGEVAAAVSAAAAGLVAKRKTPAWPAAVAAFDRSLREPCRLNPGTTADLIAAALYILLRDGRLRPVLPFPAPPFSAPPSPRETPR